MRKDQTLFGHVSFLTVSSFTNKARRGSGGCMN